MKSKKSISEKTRKKRKKEKKRMDLDDQGYLLINKYNVCR